MKIFLRTAERQLWGQGWISGQLEVPLESELKGSHTKHQWQNHEKTVCTLVRAGNKTSRGISAKKMGLSRKWGWSFQPNKEFLRTCCILDIGPGVVGTILLSRSWECKEEMSSNNFKITREVMSRVRKDIWPKVMPVSRLLEHATLCNHWEVNDGEAS